MGTDQLMRTKIVVYQPYTVSLIQEVKYTQFSNQDSSMFMRQHPKLSEFQEKLEENPKLHKDEKFKKEMNKYSDLMYCRQIDVERKKILFSGSADAFEIWKQIHAIPYEACVEQIKEKGPSGLGKGRELLPSIDGGGETGKDNNTLQFLRNGCHSSRAGFPM